MNTVSSLLDLWRLIYEISAPARQVWEHSTTSLTRSRLQMIMQYIHTNYAHQITLDELASVVSLSKSSVEKSVCAIAADTGFDNIGYFCRKFKSLYGMTPSEYRKAAQSMT